MKTMVAVSVLVIASSHVLGARISYDLSEKGALAKVKIKVVDQDGVVVPHARIWGGFTTGDGYHDYALVE